MYPYIALKIKNNVPSIMYYPEEGLNRKMTLNDENLRDIVLGLAHKLELVDKSKVNDSDATFQELLNLARESDEEYITDMPEIDLENEIEFELESQLNALLNSVLENKTEAYPGTEITPEVKKELERNQNADIFASVLDILYYILIAKTLFAASDLGISSIQLEDEHKNARLLEKMSKELEKMGIDLVLPE